MYVTGVTHTGQLVEKAGEVGQLISFAGAFVCSNVSSASFEERKAVSVSLVQIQF